MSKVAIALKIDVKKIDKAKLYQGQKGTYLDAMIFVDLDEPDQFGNCGMITQAVSKEAKAAGERGEILGNGRIVWRDEDAHRQAPAPRPQSRPSAEEFDTDIPF